MTLREPLPRLMLVGDRFTEAAIYERIVQAVTAGVHWVQLRDHAADEAEFRVTARRLVDKLRSVRPDVLVSINTRIDVAESLSCALHVGARGPEPADARPLIDPGLPVGRSVHDLNEIGVAPETDYFLWGPVFETTSKPGALGSGLATLRTACERAGGMPVIAIGGITSDLIDPCLRSGAYGVAVLSGILAAPNTPEAALRYISAIESAGR